MSKMIADEILVIFTGSQLKRVCRANSSTTQAL